MDSFSSISHLFRSKNTFWQQYDDFKKDVIELWLNQVPKAEPIAILFAKKLVRNLKTTNFPNNHIIDEGLGSMSRYVLIVVVENNLIVDDLCKSYVNVYSNFLYNAKHKFILSYELDVDQMGHLQTHLQRVYDEEGWLYAKLVQVM
jgi:hypothetical protein